MTLRRMKISKVFFSLGLIVLLLTAASGIPHFGMTMSMDEHGNMAMNDCYMPGMTALCNMNALDHPAWWQNAFTSIPTQSVMLLLLLLVAITLTFTWVQHTLSPPAESRIFTRLRDYEYNPLPTLLQELFSNGILHSKAY